MNARKLAPLVLLLAGLWAWHNSFQGPFVFDDVASIPDNPHIRHLWPIPRAMSAPPYCTVSGRPVVCLTLALNYALGGLDVRGYHAFNLAVHLLSALLLFGILRRTLQDGKFRDRFAGAAIWLAAVIALLWEVHPLQTESVTYIVQRTESLMGLFLLLTLYCVLRGSRSARPRGWYLSAVVACALGMGTKEVMVSAPLLVLLYDYVFLAPSFRELWQRRRALYIGLAVTWLILAVLVATTPRANTGFGIKGLTSWDYLRTEAGVIAWYLRLSFWPHPLVIDYFDWPVASSLQDCLVPGVVILGLLVATVCALRRRLAAGFLGAWFFLILAPTSSILPSVGEVAAERRMYLPLAAVVTMAVIGAFAIGKRLLNKPHAVVLGCLSAGSVLVALTGLTIQRNRDYRSALAIWQDTVAKRPNNARVHSNLGVALAQAHKIEEAIRQYEQALRIEPDYADAHNNLGDALIALGRLPEAIEHLEQALHLKPDYAEAHYNLGFALWQAGKTQEAIGQYEQALQFKPDYIKAYNNLGTALAQLGRGQEAIGRWEQALRLNPDLASVHCNIGVAMEQMGKASEAMKHYHQALEIDPKSAEAHYDLGNALASSGSLTEAIAQYQETLRLSPDHAGAHFNLGAALSKLGRSEAAIQQYQEALRIQPDYGAAHNSLANALARAGRLDEAIGQYQLALQSLPDSVEIHCNLAVVLERAGRVPEAIEHYQQALKLRPDLTTAKTALSRLQPGPLPHP